MSFVREGLPSGKIIEKNFDPLWLFSNLDHKVVRNLSEE